MKTIQVLVLSMLTSATFATGEDHNKSHHDQHKSNHITGEHKTYSCDLINYSGICRSYAIQPHQSDKVADLKAGCESMPSAQFKDKACPKEPLISKCINIIRDYHHPDLIYDNHYYKTESKSWTTEEVNRVCHDLGGKADKP